ncbi:BON domain-containing protein [Rheinheimera sp. NSM]|uniref:BON domain-containing protein n=1 Tax=Rheinheimera sp. NSM TaxID=3457884 RepID=UPI00403567B2
MKRTTLTMMMALALTTTAVAANDWKDGAKDAWIDGKAETTLLLNGNLNSFDINTDVKNGAVTLTGKVENEVDKALAEELIENLDGVTGVDNQLTVVASGNKGNKAGDKDNSGLKDAKIATVVKTRLLFESEVSGTAIDVDAENGVVTLQGEVDSAAEKDLAVAIAKNTADVSRVIDKLQVAQ